MALTCAGMSLEYEFSTRYLCIGDAENGGTGECTARYEHGAPLRVPGTQGSMYRYLCGAVAPRVRQSELLVRAAYGAITELQALWLRASQTRSASRALCCTARKCCRTDGHQSAPPSRSSSGPKSPSRTPPMSKFPNPSSPLQTISLHLNATDAQRGSVSSSISPFDAPIRPLATAISPSEPSSNALTPPEAEPEPDPEPDAADTDTDKTQRGRDGDVDDVVPCE